MTVSKPSGAATAKHGEKLAGAPGIAGSSDNHGVLGDAIRSMSAFDGLQGRVHYRHWAAAEPRAAIVLLHGLGEHSGFYERFGSRVASNGVSVYAIDFAGHGLSEGPRGVIRDVNHLLDDVERLVSLAELEGVAVAVVGHAMGALVASLVVAKDSVRYAGMVVSGGDVTPNDLTYAALGLDDETLEAAAPSPRMLSSDQWYLDLLEADPLAYDSGLSRATLEALIAAWMRLADATDRLQLPVLVVHGERDTIVSTEVIKAWAASLPDVRTCVVPRSHHDVLNDQDHDLVADVVRWFVLSPGATGQTDFDDPTFPRSRLDATARVPQSWDTVAERPPDIVLIMTDEQRFDWVGYASDGYFETPNIDRLALSGVCFEQAYSASTTCVPARTALLTGLHHRNTPTENSSLALRAGFWTVARELRAAGYETALIGRMHFTPIHADHGFDTMRMCENISAGSGYEHTGDNDDYGAWLAAQDRPDWRVVRRRPNGTLRPKPAEIPRVFSDDAGYHPTSWIERETTEFLAGRDRSRPLFLIVSFPHPHAPYDPPEPYASMYSAADTVLPEDGFDVNEMLRGTFRERLEGPTVHAIRDDQSAALLRRVLTAIRGLVRHIDDSVGEIINALDLDSSLVFFTSDHGDYGGHRGLFTKVPWIPFDDLIRVPLIVAGGAVGTPQRSPSLVQSASFAATCLDYAGITTPDNAFDFPSLRPLLDGNAKAYDLDRPVVMNDSYLMIRRGSLKLITTYPKAIRGEPGTDDLLLFDLENDPGETVSRGGDPAYAKHVAELLAVLQAQISQPSVVWRFRERPGQRRAATR